MGRGITIDLFPYAAQCVASPNFGGWNVCKKKLTDPQPKIGREGTAKEKPQENSSYSLKLLAPMP